MTPPAVAAAVRGTVTTRGSIRRAESAIASGGASTLSSIAVIAAACIVAAFGAAIDLTSGVLRWPEAFAVLTAWWTCATVIAGVVWQRTRPQSSMGVVLIAMGFLTSIQFLQGSSNPALFTIGLLADPVVFVAIVYVLISYPRGTLDRIGRRVVAAAVVVDLVAVLPLLITSSSTAAQGPLAACASTCPPNLLAIEALNAGSATFIAFTDLARAVFAVGFVVAVAIRWRDASRPRRRVLRPVALVGLAIVVPFGLYGLGRLAPGGGPGAALVASILLLARSVLPIATIGGLVGASRFAARALEDIVGHLAPIGEATSLGAAIGDALDDPDLRVLYEDSDGTWTDDSGDLVIAAEPARGRSHLWLVGGDGLATVIDHDTELDGDPELLAAAAMVVLHDREHVVLTARLGASVEELHALQRRLAVAGLAERRRLERDLHDGAQQRLMALRIQLNLLRDRTADAEISGQLTALVGEMDETIAEVRRIARGVYPALLTDGGLAEAVNQVVRRTPNARLDAPGVARVSADLEAAAYFCILEAVQNATRHAGPKATIEVRLSTTDDALAFDVEDDGVGFDPEHVTGQGTGLSNLSDRLAQVGGVLAVASRPGRGARISGTIPREATGPQVEGR